jgi:hypothetical protein
MTALSDVVIASEAKPCTSGQFVIPGRCEASNLEIPDRRFASSGMTIGEMDALLGSNNRCSCPRNRLAAPQNRTHDGMGFADLIRCRENSRLAVSYDG